ncbi:hypothetical protein T08_339, partial [Trichinella sp. T8]
MKQRMTVKRMKLHFLRYWTCRYCEGLPPVTMLTSSAGATLKATLLSLKIRNLAPGVASGYAPGQIKICIFPQGMPQAIYSTIIGLRG